MHTRQHEVGQEMQLFLVFNAIERYEKRYGFVHMLSINCHHYGCVKLTMSIDASGTIRNCGVVYSIGEKKAYQPFFHSEKTVIKHPACTTTKKAMFS